MSPTPEAKLLELIKKSSPRPQGPITASGIHKTLRGIRKLKDHWMQLSWLQKINHLLLSASAAGMVWMVIGILRPTADVISVGTEIQSKESPRSDEKMIQLGEIRERNLFKPLYQPPPPPPKIIKPILPLAPPPPPPVPLSQRLSHLRFVGMLSGTAVLEDQKGQKTLYVAPGDRVGEVEVEKISNDRVIFKSGEERYALSM